MQIIGRSFVFAIFIVINGCAVLKESPKYKLQDGFYKSRVPGEKKVKIYVDNNDTAINIYRSSRNNILATVDSLPKSSLSLPQQYSNVDPATHIFNKTSFDIDFFTFPFKYRPAQKNLPKQFNTTLNGAVYLGFRNDVFKLKYKKSPLNKYERETDHYGFSFGIFTGLGGTVMNPSTTDGHIIYEYDGIVWTKGVAGIIAVNNFTVGLALGTDDLLDHNHLFWNYQHKPWIGLALGINLN